ncbi:hypothetical protein FQN54_005164 [Arachnomyces sp. PD_36]|nr:hypothetical protein FQN54_005164 [Arachnomyces sp. PD_36]
MTLFSRRRRRRYSWPYSTPNTTRVQDRQNPIPDNDIRALKQYFGDDKNGKSQRVPIVETTEKFGYMDSDDGDDALSAGIVRSKTMRHTRRIWPSSCCDDSDDNMDDDIVSTVTEAGEVPSAILRRIVPQVDRAKMFSALSSSSSDHAKSDGDGDEVMVSYFETNDQQKGSRAQGRQQRTQDTSYLTDPRLQPEHSQRRHRRCHSEQPRAWREPSAELWPLKEE